MARIGLAVGGNGMPNELKLVAPGLYELVNLEVPVRDYFYVPGSEEKSSYRQREDRPKDAGDSDEGRYRNETRKDNN